MQEFNYNESFERYPVGMAYVPWQHMRHHLSRT